MSRGFIDGEYQDGELRGLVFLVGRRGFGKTTEMDRLLQTCTGGVLFFDTLSKHATVFPGYIVFAQPGPLVDYLRVNRGRRFRVLYQPRKGNLDQHFREVCRIIKTFGWMIFGVDELDKLCGARWGDARMPPEFYDLVNYGRHARVSMIATARRPQGVAAGFKAECEYRIFRLKDQKALDSVALDIGEAHIPQIRQLDKYYYLKCSEDDDPILCGGPRGTSGGNRCQVAGQLSEQ